MASCRPASRRSLALTFYANDGAAVCDVGEIDLDRRN
jgi:hypothetical protein